MEIIYVYETSWSDLRNLWTTEDDVVSKKSPFILFRNLNHIWTQKRRSGFSVVEWVLHIWWVLVSVRPSFRIHYYYTESHSSPKVKGRCCQATSNQRKSKTRFSTNLFLFSAANAKMGLTETKLGIIPGGGEKIWQYGFQARTNITSGLSITLSRLVSRSPYNFIAVVRVSVRVVV